MPSHYSSPHAAVESPSSLHQCPSPAHAAFPYSHPFTHASSSPAFPSSTCLAIFMGLPAATAQPLHIHFVANTLTRVSCSIVAPTRGGHGRRGCLKLNVGSAPSPPRPTGTTLRDARRSGRYRCRQPAHPASPCDQDVAGQCSPTTALQGLGHGGLRRLRPAGGAECATAGGASPAQPIRALQPSQPAHLLADVFSSERSLPVPVGSRICSWRGGSRPAPAGATSPTSRMLVLRSSLSAPIRLCTYSLSQPRKVLCTHSRCPPHARRPLARKKHDEGRHALPRPPSGRW